MIGAHKRASEPGDGGGGGGRSERATLALANASEGRSEGVVGALLYKLLFLRRRKVNIPTVSQPRSPRKDGGFF